ncbi:MAG: Mov34/MPN/PAD-1 family protein [Phycisphaerae bacterium]|nr:Mov34/MPN/PAD-1 family protein [Phycisphaerae bacterium]MCZ2399147.1 Mov34/MPN/PAD-1 family protein [Phycisphaerae bacterium]
MCSPADPATEPARPLWLAPAALAAALADARRRQPREACGVLAGDVSAVGAAIAVRNLAQSPGRFELDPLDVVRVERAVRRSGRQLVGYYHSHPHGAIAPSAQDIGGTLWAEEGPHWHLIVSPAGAWVMFDTRHRPWRAAWAVPLSPHDARNFSAARAGPVSL